MLMFVIEWCGNFEIRGATLSELFTSLFFAKLILQLEA